MMTSRTTFVLLAAGLMAAAGVHAQTMDRQARDQAVERASQQYKADKARCDALSGNAKDICIEEAKGREKVARADAEAAYRHTPKAREDARVARADATYEVAKEKCDDLAGNAKDVCRKEAVAAHVKAKADARVDRVSADTRQDAAQRNADAQRTAADEKRDADYQVALEKCDAMSGSARDMCVREAKSRFGKS